MVSALFQTLSMHYLFVGAHLLSHVLLCQAPLSMGFPRQEYWSGLPFPTPGYLPNPGMKPMSPVLATRFLTTSPTLEAPLERSSPILDIRKLSLKPAKI